MVNISYAQGTHLVTDIKFRFTGGRALCPDGVARNLKRVSPDAGELISGISIRAAVEHRGATVTGSLILRRPGLDDGPMPLEFTPDPDGRNAHLFGLITCSP